MIRPRAVKGFKPLKLQGLKASGEHSEGAGAQAPW
jgi:hypothetical protein